MLRTKTPKPSPLNNSTQVGAQVISATEGAVEARAVDILRRLDRGETIRIEEWEVVIKATDEELAVVYRDPTQWSYVVRDPTGDLAGQGKAKTLKECERWAIRLAEEHVYEHFWIIIDTGAPPFDFVWNWKLLGKWRFVLWPPKGSA